MILVVKKNQTKHIYKQQQGNYMKKQMVNYLVQNIKRLNNIIKIYLFICLFINLK